MIIQLKGMSFNNDVVFGKAIELTEETKALFGVGGYTKSFTDNQKILLQSAIEQLQESGIWSKIDKLYLPCLAGTDGEAFLDVKNSYGNGSNVIDTVKNGVTATVSDNKVDIGGTLSSIEMETLTGVDYTIENLQDFHLGIKFKSINTNTGSLKDLCNIHDSINGGRRPLAVQGSATAFNITINGVNNSLTKANSDIAYPYIFSFIDSNYKAGISYGNESSEVSYKEVERNSGDWQSNYATLITPVTLNMFKMWNNNLVPYHEIQFITLGKSLTEEESRNYNQIIHNLISSIFA